MKKLKILVTGTGITGKSMFRRELVMQLRDMGLVAEHFDADCFQELRHPVDVDCLKKLPEVFLENAVYVIEDVHGPIPKEATLPIEDYDFIFYLKPSFLHHLFFWLDRSPKWFTAGVHSWDQKKGWEGTGQSKDWRNIWPIIKTTGRDVINWKKWIAEDLTVIRSLRFKIVESFWTKDGPRFKVLF